MGYDAGNCGVVRAGCDGDAAQGTGHTIVRCEVARKRSIGVINAECGRIATSRLHAAVPTALRHALCPCCMPGRACCLSAVDTIYHATINAAREAEGAAASRRRQQLGGRDNGDSDRRARRKREGLSFYSPSRAPPLRDTDSNGQGTLQTTMSSPREAE